MKRLILIGFVITGLFFSCQKETTKNSDAEMKQANQENSTGESCFDFVYPVTYIMPDGTTITGNSKDELRLAIKSWYEANPGSKDKPVLQYPVDVNFKGRIVTINSDREMLRIKKACEKEKKPCFVFVYPITYIMPDGIVFTISSEDDYETKRAIRAWYVENPGVAEKPSLQYPVEIKFRDGKTLTINNDDEMSRARASCD